MTDDPAQRTPREAPGSIPPDRAHVLAEQRNERTGSLHTMSVDEIARAIHDEDRRMLDAFELALPELTALIEAAEPGFIASGRLIYLGAGTSGRLGVLDASEAPPTFQVEPGRIVGIIAGGDAALRRSSEHKEDEPEGALPELQALAPTPSDTVIGLAAGGTTPFVRGAMAIAKRLCPNCLTAMLSCSPTEKPPGCDRLVVIPTGPEVLTGSTRMKAGTATKLALNTISTTLMVRSGRVYQNLMVDLRASNDKLKDRAARIVAELTGLDRPGSLELLDLAGGGVKAAVVMHRLGVDLAEAEKRLSAAGGRLDRVIDP